MARCDFRSYSRARRFAAPCRVGYETGENYGKRRWKAVVENDSGTAYSNRPRRHRFAPWRKSLAVANRLPAVCISFAAFARARFSTADGWLPAAADAAEPSETSDDPASLEPPSEASLRASIRNPNATTSVKAAARSSATAKSPVNAPAKIESAVRAMSFSVGAWSTPAIAEAVVATGSPTCSTVARSIRGSSASTTYAADTVATECPAASRGRHGSTVRRSRPRLRGPPASARGPPVRRPACGARGQAAPRPTHGTFR